jgi:hypothetical protein
MRRRCHDECPAPSSQHGAGRTIGGVELDLARLKEMHPRLPLSIASAFEHRAAIALRRRQHEPGVTLAVAIESTTGSALLRWRPVPAGDEEQLDRHRITEDGAEAVALALVHVAQGWVGLRRLQRGESADWLLKDRDDRRIALEVSGVDGPHDSQRLADKLEQVIRATFADVKSACVVAFLTPAASLASA